MRSRFGRGPAAALALGLALAVAGCTGVPTSGPVTRVSAAPGRINPGVEIAPAPPERDATPIEVVEGFLHAMASWQPHYVVARDYLTPEASASWRPESGVRVYAEGNPVVATDTTAFLRAPVVGSLDPSGAYRQSSGMLEHDFGLTKDAAGQWRISKPPDGLVISEYLFSSAFTRVMTYFFAPGGGWLVPDPRFFPRGAQAQDGAARAVVGGPTSWLAPATEAAHPWAALDQVTITPGGVAQVALRRGATELTPGQKESLVTQLAWTFRQFESVASIEVRWVGEDSWDVPPYGRVVPTSAFPEADPASRQGSRQLFAVAGGRVVRPVEGPQGLTSLVVAPSVVEASTASVRLDALVVAAVVADRRSLVVAPALGEGGEAVAAGVGLRRPHWSRQGDLWFSNDAGQLSVLAEGGEAEVVPVGGMGEGRVEAMRLSPDGVRIALVVQRPGGQRVLGLARVAREDGRVTVDGWRQLEVATSPVASLSVLDAGWRTPDSLLVLAGDGRSTSVLAVAQDGSSVAPIGPASMTNLVELAVAPGVPPMVRTKEGDVWRYNSDFRWSLLTTQVSSVAYPG